jgi:hypothetical protein
LIWRATYDPCPMEAANRFLRQPDRSDADT